MPAICALLPAGQHRAVRCELIGLPADGSLACRHDACSGIKVVPVLTGDDPATGFSTVGVQEVPAICALVPAGPHRTGGLEEVGFVSHLLLVGGHLPRYRVKVVPSASVTQPTINFGAVRSRIMPPIGHLNPTGTHRTRTIKQIKNRTNLMTTRLHLPRFRIEVVPSTSIIQPTCGKSARRGCVEPRIRVAEPATCHGPVRVKVVGGAVNARP